MPLRQVESDTGPNAMQLSGREFLYTPEARGLSVEAIRKIDELVDGVGLIRNQERVRWRDMTTLFDDLEKRPKTRQTFGPVVQGELRRRLALNRAGKGDTEPSGT